MLSVQACESYPACFIFSLMTSERPASSREEFRRPISSACPWATRVSGADNRKGGAPASRRSALIRRSKSSRRSSWAPAGPAVGRRRRRAREGPLVSWQPVQRDRGGGLFPVSSFAPGRGIGSPHLGDHTSRSRARAFRPRISPGRLPLADRRVLDQRRHRQRRVPVPAAAAVILGGASVGRSSLAGPRSPAGALLRRGVELLRPPGRRVPVHLRRVRRTRRLRGRLDDLDRPRGVGRRACRRALPRR